MRFATTFATLLTVGLAAAQSRRATCAAQNILDACLATENAQLTACEANDWSCLCEQSNNVLTCYNNCPGDDGQFGAQQTMTSYCNANKAYGTTTSTTASATPSASSSSSSASSAATETSSSETSESSASKTSSSSSATGTFIAGNSHSGAGASAVGTFQGSLLAMLALGLGVAL